MGLTVELYNKNNGQHERIRNDAPQILLPSRNALYKMTNNNNLPLQSFFQHLLKPQEQLSSKMAKSMLVRSKGKMLKHPVKQNVVSVMKIDEVHTSAKRFFLVKII